MKHRERTLLASIFLFWFSLYTYPSFLSSYAEGVLGATSVMTGLIVGSYGFTQMALRIPLGILSDLTRKRKVYVMMGFAASMVASMGLSAVAISADGARAGLVVAALIFRGVSGVAAASWVTFSVLYSASYPPERTAEAMSRIALPQYLSQVAAMLLGAWIMNAFGARWAFLLASVAGAAGMLALSRVPDIPPAGGGALTRAGFFEVLRDRNLIAGSILATLLFLVNWATVLGFVQNWARAYVAGFGDAHLGWLSVAYLLPSAIISRFSGRLARRIGRAPVLAGSFLLVCAACLLYPHARTLARLFANQTLIGAGMGMIMPLSMAAAIETVPDQRRGAAMGVFQAVYGIGMFLGPVVAGKVIDHFSAGEDLYGGYTANFMMCAAIALAGAALSIVVTRGRAKGNQ
ncbi:MAG: MFS transporter [Christensenellales bacterium]|jgi:MFS family permease